MPNYDGQLCASCREVFKQGDDIVVCPICGSPYHRECYKKEGKCINTILHENGESWRPEPLAGSHTDTEDIENTHEKTLSEEAAEQRTDGVVKCRNCGAENSAQSPFCSVCGAPINMEKAAGGFGSANAGQSYWNGQRQYTNYDQSAGNGQPFFGGMPFAGAQPINNDMDVDGNTVGEYSRYVGSNRFYFLPKFLRFAKGGVASFNFGAFFFPQLYFFYRKMILTGVVMVLLDVILSAPYALFVLETNGLISHIPAISQPWFAQLINGCSFVAYLLKIAVGIFANYLYYRKAKHDVDMIKHTITEKTTQDSRLAGMGGVSWAYVIAGIIAETIVVTAIMLSGGILL